MFRWKVVKFFLCKISDRELPDNKGSLHVHGFLREEHVAFPDLRVPCHGVPSLFNHLEFLVAVLVEQFLVGIQRLCNHADCILDGIRLSPAEDECGKVHVRDIPCTAIEVSLSVNPCFEPLEFTAVYNAVKLHAGDSGEHAANLLDSSAEVVVADMGHRLQDKCDFV